MVGIEYSNIQQSPCTVDLFYQPPSECLHYSVNIHGTCDVHVTYV
jgi:hypothetical protein